MIDFARQMEDGSQGPRYPFHRRAASVVRGAMSITVLALIVAGTSVVVAPAGEPVRPQSVGRGADPGKSEGLPADSLIQESSAEPIDNESPIHRAWVVTESGIFLIASPAVASNVAAPDLGYLLYWWYYETDLVYVYGRLASEKIHLGQAAIALRRDLGFEEATLQEWDETMYEAQVMAGDDIPDDVGWQPAEGKTVRRILRDAGMPAPLDDVDHLQRAVEWAMSMLASHPNPNGGRGSPVPAGINLGGAALALRGPCCFDDPDPETCVCCPLRSSGDAPTVDGAGGVCCTAGCSDGNPCTVQDRCGNPDGLFCQCSGVLRAAEAMRRRRSVYGRLVLNGRVCA